MPTGTLANHMAVRALAGGPSRVIVQEESHFYQDEGDCAQTLSNLTLMPLATGRATFTADEVQHVLDQTKSARVVSRVSVIALETPVRRKQGEHFDPAEVKKIVALARREGIRLHLDGARLFLQAAYTGEQRRRLRAAVRHRVRVALQVLQRRFRRDSRRPARSDRRDVSRAADVRRRPQQRLAVRAGGAPLSCRVRRSIQSGGSRIRGLDWPACVNTTRSRSSAFRRARICSGSSVRSTDPVAFQKRLAAKGVMLSAPQRGAFLVGVNETLNRTTAAELADAFVRAQLRAGRAGRRVGRVGQVGQV